jgi:predicted nucleotidyltransferase
MNEKMKKILLEVPNSTEVYVFGSILKSPEPNDLDILVVYNSNIYPKATIYKACEKLKSSLTKIFKLNVDLTVLSYSENNELKFSEEVKAVELKKFLQYETIKYKN